MHANAFDRYHRGESLLHNLDPRVKIILTVAFILSNAFLPDAAWIGFALSFAFLLGANLLSGLGIAFTLKRSYIALPFALASLTTLFTIPGETLAELNLGFTTLTVTAPGLARFTSILVRSWLSVQMAVLLVAVTPFPDILHGLQHLKVPAVLVGIISFMYRYLFVLTDEVLRLHRARMSRSAILPGRDGGGKLTWRAKVAGNMAGQLFVRSLDRSDRIYNAMLARGFTGQLLTLTPHTFLPRDWATVLSGIAMLLLFQLASRLLVSG